MADAGPEDDLARVVRVPHVRAQPRLQQLAGFGGALEPVQFKIGAAFDQQARQRDRSTTESGHSQRAAWRHHSEMGPSTTSHCNTACSRKTMNRLFHQKPGSQLLSNQRVTCVFVGPRASVARPARRTTCPTKV